MKGSSLKFLAMDNDRIFGFPNPLTYSLRQTTIYDTPPPHHAHEKCLRFTFPKRGRRVSLLPPSPPDVPSKLNTSRPGRSAVLLPTAPLLSCCSAYTHCIPLTVWVRSPFVHHTGGPSTGLKWARVRPSGPSSKVLGCIR